MLPKIILNFYLNYCYISQKVWIVCRWGRHVIVFCFYPSDIISPSTIFTGHIWTIWPCSQTNILRNGPGCLPMVVQIWHCLASPLHDGPEDTISALSGGSCLKCWAKGEPKGNFALKVQLGRDWKVLHHCPVQPNCRRSLVGPFGSKQRKLSKIWGIFKN